MKPRDLIRAAGWGLASKPLRSGALAISLAAGVSAAVFVSAIVSGFGREIDRLAFGSYATALVIQANVLAPDRLGKPRLGEAEKLAANLPQASSFAAWKSGPVVVVRDGRAIGLTVHGVRGDYQHELDAPIAAGRMLTLAETAGAGKPCLLGADAATELGRAGQVGQRLRLNGRDCEVVGVLGAPRSRPAARFSQGVIVPFSAAERHFIAASDAGAPGSADRITFFLRPGADMQQAEMQADLFLRKQRGVALTRPSPFAFGDMNASLKQLTEQRQMLSKLLGALAFLSLFTSLVAFAAIGASTIASRQREIALRMAMGASDTDIQSQIVAETVGIGLVGGAAGLVAGLAIGATLARLWHWPFLPNPGLALLALGLGIGVGTGVGLVLARRASELPPALAARG